jgi:oligopeptide transport system substrate-binding protein
MKRLGLLVVLVMIASLLATCGTTPTPQVIEKIVTQEVEKQVTSVVEKEVTQVVTEKETVIVQSTPEVVEKVVTATPVPHEPIVFRVPISSDPEGTLEPGLTLALVTGWLAENLHAGLLKYDEDTNITPYIAESWDISDDGLTYTFHLRSDPTWHNGRPIVAEDFKKGWERYLDPNVAAQAAGDYLGSIVGAQDVLDGKTKELAGVEVVDDHTLKVTTVQPDPAFLLRMASPYGWVVPSESVVEGKPEWVDKPVGAGPFKFVEWKTNEKVVLEANDDFFLGRPLIDEIDYLVVPDPATSLAMYEAGELDIVDVGGADLQRVQEDPVLSKELKYWTRAQLLYYGLNMYIHDEFKDVRVRQAFNYALDKQQIIDNILFGAYQPATGLVPPGIPEYNPKLKGYAYDPAKAQQLMADAGYPGGAGFPPMQVSSSSAYATEMEAFAAQVNENLGLSLEVNVVERGEMITGLWGHDSWDIFRWGWTADFPSAEVWTHQLLHSGLDSNFFGYNNPTFDALVDEARVTQDEAKRVSLWQQAEQIAMDEAAMIPFGYSQYIELVKPYVKGVAFNLNGPMWYKYVTFEK